jgi:coenzyme F420-0:L-glutamate ligase/coenzyme F420-1:gamma-L-glutamate ligase
VTPGSQLILTALPGLPLVQIGDDLAKLCLGGLREAEIQLEDGDILVLAQKVVSKAEGRFKYLKDVVPSEEARRVAELTKKDPRLVELILSESSRVLRTRPGLIIVEHRLGFVCANAGIDASNVQLADGGKRERVLLLPEDPDASAEGILTQLNQVSGASLGVLIIDSHGRAWREGSVGVVIGAAGVAVVADLRGTPDLFGVPLRSTRVGIADEVAAAASIIMGQAAEGLPVVHVRGFPYPLQSGSVKDLIRPAEQDLFRN